MHVVTLAPDRFKCPAPRANSITGYNGPGRTVSHAVLRARPVGADHDAPRQLVKGQLRCAISFAPRRGFWSNARVQGRRGRAAASADIVRARHVAKKGAIMRAQRRALVVLLLVLAAAP